MKIWTENIIIAVIISIIIEMLLPEGNNKKYVKVISGIYILYVIVNPILNLDEKFDLSQITNSIISNETVQTVSNADVAKTYLLSLQDALKGQIQNLGYSVENVAFTVTTDYKEIDSINIKMKVGTNFDREKIVELILNNYEIDKSKINIS